jgi:hypothetical protein
MTTALDESNAALREAVETRLSGGCCDGGKCQPAEDAGKRSKVKAQASATKCVDRFCGDSLLDDQGDIRPGSREFLEVLDELRTLHLRKTKDYGVDEDALSNIRQSADVVNMPAWAGCILRISDKMHRLKAFFRRGRCEFDGVEDTLKDIACYAAIALVLYREQLDD